MPNPEGKIYLNDLHGCLWKKDQGAPFYTQSVLTNDQVGELARPLEELSPWKVMMPLSPYEFQMPGEGWTPLSNALGFDPETVSELRGHYRKDIPLWKAGFNWVSEKDHWINHFIPYTADPREASAIDLINKDGDAVVVGTALPALARGIFMDRMVKDGVWSNLGGQDCPPAVLRASEDYTSIFYKAVLYRVFGEVADSTNRRVVGIDDDYVIALTLSYLYNAEIHLPISEEEAKKQSSLVIPDKLQRHSLNGLLVFNSSLHEEVQKKRKENELVIP